MMDETSFQQHLTPNQAVAGSADVGAARLGDVVVEEEALVEERAGIGALIELGRRQGYVTFDDVLVASSLVD